MSTIMFKCPCCGGYLEFDAALQKFKCLYCSQIFTQQELEEQSEAQADAAAEAEETAQQEAAAEPEKAAQEPEHAAMKGYHCRMCGAEIVTEATTAATRCYYCHSPIVLQDRLDEAFRPDGVVPFQMDRNTAMQRFREYIGRKKFVDKRFFDDAQLEMFTGVYYPFWYFDVEGEASFEGQGTRRSVTTTPSYIITTTRFFNVRRRAVMSFRDMARKALGKLDIQLSDGLHPYDSAGVKPYSAGFLSGFLAEKRDLEADVMQTTVMQEVQGYADSMIRRGHTYNSLTGTSSFRAGSIKKRYLLLPVWVLTWKGGKEGLPYYYLMNGQTGKVCGKLPIDWGKLAGLAVGVGAAVAALLMLGGKFIW